MLQKRKVETFLGKIETLYLVKVPLKRSLAIRKSVIYFFNLVIPFCFLPGTRVLSVEY